MLMVRHDFHWLSDGEHEVPTVRSLGVRLSKLSVAGEGEDDELAEGEIAAASSFFLVQFKNFRATRMYE